MSLSDENYNNQLNDTKSALIQWSEHNSAGAEMIIDGTSTYWRISARPAEPSLCPIELILRSDRKYDLAIASATVEDREIESFALFHELFDSVAAGRPFSRAFISRNTSQHLGMTTTVPLSELPDWEFRILTPLGEVCGLEDALVEERHYARYTRA
ncbi:MAG: hypothetical protein ACR2OV_04800 [Hyphomicrobiaceae bacterium]